MKQELTQEIFKDQPNNVNWAGVDYDGLLSFGESINPRFTWASERWRGFTCISKIENTDFKPLTEIYRITSTISTYGK